MRVKTRWKGAFPNASQILDLVLTLAIIHFFKKQKDKVIAQPYLMSHSSWFASCSSTQGYIKLELRGGYDLAHHIRSKLLTDLSQCHANLAKPKFLHSGKGILVFKNRYQTSNK